MQVFPSEASLVKFRWSKSVAEQMVACFVLKFGVATVPLQDLKKVSSKWYIDYCGLESFRSGASATHMVEPKARCSTKLLPALTQWLLLFMVKLTVLIWLLIYLTHQTSPHATRFCFQSSSSGYGGYSCRALKMLGTYFEGIIFTMP